MRDDELDENGIVKEGPMQGRKKCISCKCYYHPGYDHVCPPWMLMLLKMQAESPELAK